MLRQIPLPALCRDELVPVRGDRGVAGAEGPVLEEHVLELRDHRAFETEVQIRDPVSARALVEIAVADVHAAGESDPMVHDQHFAVVAQVDVDRGRQQPRRQEARMPHPLLPEDPARVGPGVVLADPVDDYPHVHIALPGPIERVEEGVSGGVGLKEVALKQNALARAVDGGEHRRIGLLAVEQGNDLVALEQRSPGHRFRHAGDALELVLEVLERHSGLGLRPIADPVQVEVHGPVGFELSRPGGDPVDAEEQVQDRPREGKEEAYRNPAERGARVALAQEHVPGSRDGHDRGKGPDEQGDHVRGSDAVKRSDRGWTCNDEARQRRRPRSSVATGRAASPGPPRRARARAGEAARVQPGASPR